MNTNNNPINFYIVVNIDCGIEKGKVHAHVGHATQALCEYYYSTLVNSPGEFKKLIKLYKEWTDTGSAKIVLKASQFDFNLLKKEKPLCVIKDAGHTQINPGTETVLAFFPMYKYNGSVILQSLKLL